MDMQNQRKIDKLNNRLKGWHKHFRGRFLLLKVLTMQEFVLWDLSFSVLADWHIPPRNTYGTFTYTNAEIGHLLNCDGSLISRRSKKLFKLNLWNKLEDGSIEVAGFNLNQNVGTLTKELGVIDLLTYLANQQVLNVNKHEQIANSQIHNPKENTQSPVQTDVNLHNETSKEPLVSFKNKFNSNAIKKVIIKGKIRTDEEYQKIYAEGNYNGLTPEDMKWIDENVSEVHEVEEDTEKKLVDTFFNGNWEEYRKHTFMANNSFEQSNYK